MLPKRLHSWWSCVRPWLDAAEADRPCPFSLRSTTGGGALMSSPVHSANPCRCNVKLVVSWCTAGRNPPKGPGSAQIGASDSVVFCIGESPQPKFYAWNGFGGTGVEMQRRTSSPQQEPCPAYIASKSMTSCFIRYDFNMSEICSDTDEE